MRLRHTISPQVMEMRPLTLKQLLLPLKLRRWRPSVQHGAQVSLRKPRICDCSQQETQHKGMTCLFIKAGGHRSDTIFSERADFSLPMLSGALLWTWPGASGGQWPLRGADGPITTRAPAAPERGERGPSKDAREQTQQISERPQQFLQPKAALV